MIWIVKQIIKFLLDVYSENFKFTYIRCIVLDIDSEYYILNHNTHTHIYVYTYTYTYLFL